MIRALGAAEAPIKTPVLRGGAVDPRWWTSLTTETSGGDVSSINLLGLLFCRLS